MVSVVLFIAFRDFQSVRVEGVRGESMRVQGSLAHPGQMGVLLSPVINLLCFFPPHLTVLVVARCNYHAHRSAVAEERGRCV